MNDLRRLAAGVICGGFAAKEIDAALEAKLRKLPLAGVTIFGGNIETVAQTRALTDRLREVVPSPVIAIDQEGGRVARLREGVEVIPSMMAVAATRDAQLAERAGAQIAFDLRRVGVNLNFAPVLDLALYRMNTVIGTRSFGDDPGEVTRLAGALARGLEDGGIPATFKHFPGHGSTAIDSHLNLPVIDLDEATLRARDLRPFAALLPRAAAVMTAHIVVNSLDRDRPATLSRRILTQLLREDLGFTGVCFTDCLQMDAIAKGAGSEAGAVAALGAGADCLLVSHDLDLAEAIAGAVASAVESGKLPRARLEEAHSRVLALRNRLQEPLPLDAQAPFEGIGETIGLRAVTLLRGDPRVDPHASIALSFEGATVEGAQGAHSAHASLSDFARIQTVALPLEPEDAALDAALLRASGLRPVVLMRRAHIYARQKAAVERILDSRPDAVVVSLREPYDALEFTRAQAVLCTYSDEWPSIAGLAAVLFDGAPARGSIPLQGVPVAGP